MSKNIRRIAYQHTIIYQHQHAFNRSISEEFDPDVNLTAGEVAPEMFSRGELSDKRMAVAGLLRYQKAVLI